jgi:outer membrane protein OmpA-like peptidoglycan-associated protein
MKSLTNSNKGSRLAWSPCGLAIKSLIGGALILTGFQSTLQAQEVQFTKPSWYFGVAGGANVNFLRGTTQELNSNLTVPSAFHDGNGVGLYVAPLIEYHRPDTRLGLMLQVGYDSRKGSFNEVMTPCNCPADLNTDLSYLTVEPSLRFAPFKSNFYLYGGPRFAFNLSKSFTYKQGINPAYPLQVANPDVTSDFSNVKDNLISMQIGAGYDIPLSSQRSQTQLVLSPFVSFQPYFGQDPRSIESLNVTTLRAGVALKLGRGHKIAQPVVIEPIPEAKPEPKPELKPEPIPEPAPIVVVKPVVIGNVYKVYFAFDKWNLDARSTADLDNLARDMNENPSVNVTIESHTDSRGPESYNMKLSEKRGKSVIDYMAAKGVNVSRIKAQAFGETKLINKCADGVPCTENEHAVNRRTESVITEE